MSVRLTTVTWTLTPKVLRRGIPGRPTIGNGCLQDLVDISFSARSDSLWTSRAARNCKCRPCALGLDFLYQDAFRRRNILPMPSKPLLQQHSHSRYFGGPATKKHQLYAVGIWKTLPPLLHHPEESLSTNQLALFWNTKNLGYSYLLSFMDIPIRQYKQAKQGMIAASKKLDEGYFKDDIVRKNLQAQNHFQKQLCR
jgi:hypothetical protein